MSDQVFDSFKNQSAKMLDQSTKLLGPSRELNKLALSKLEQLLSLQQSAQKYAELEQHCHSQQDALHERESRIQALTAEQPFCLKDPRMSVTLPACMTARNTSI